MTTLRPGDVVGGCRIVRVIGEGGQGCVCEVCTPEGERLAMKILVCFGGLASRTAERFGVECESLALIDEVNVPRFYRAGVDGDRVWLLVEFVDGESLREKLRPPRPRPPLPDLVRWIIQACDGVAAAHARGIIHRDIKPENLLITPAGVVKVIDFGFAKLEHLGVQTTAGTLVGSALYMPPEQLRNEPPHTSWDVFAMGVVLHEAIAGAHPTATRSTNLVDIVTRHRAIPPRPLAEAAPGVPLDLADIVDRAVQEKWWRRPTMRGLADELREAHYRLRSPQRADARNLPLPNRPAAGAPTEPLPVYTPAPSARPLAPTQPLAAWQEERAAGDRPAHPPPPSVAAIAPVVSAPVSARAPALAATVIDTQMPLPVAAGRPSATSGHDVSAAPVEASLRASRGSTPGGKRGRAAFAGATLLLAASGAGVWVWYASAPGPSERATGAAAGVVLPPPVASASTAPSASAPAASASAAPPRPGGHPAKRGRGR